LDGDGGLDAHRPGPTGLVKGRRGVPTPERRAKPVERLQAEFWRTYVHIGVITYGLGGLAAFGYVLGTPHGPHRGILLVLDGATVSASIGLFWWLGLRLVPTRWRTAFFSAWTVTTFAFIGTAAGLDGGTSSPMSYFLVLPLLFAGLAYPPRTVATLTGTGMLTALVVGLVAPAPDASATALLVASMFIAGLLTGAMARNRGRLTDALFEAATHDGLTGCMTRRSFYERLQHELARSRRYGKPFTVVVADLDNLKLLNDRGGHEAGDEALRVVAAALQAEARGTDLVGRLGGDEFGMLLPETEETGAAVVAGRLLAAIRGSGGSVPTTASLGVATWTGPGDRADALMRRADQALYSAKASGRDSFCGPGASSANVATDGDGRQVRPPSATFPAHERPRTDAAS
jgi:diguanylate cyclase (GGDEF)-like protein